MDHQKSKNLQTPELTRREFIETGVQSVATIALGTTALCMFAACGKSSGTASTPSATLSNSANNIYTLSFSQFSSLQNAGGSVHVAISATSGSKDLYVTRVSNISAIAVSTVCTHQSCTLNTYDSNLQQYACPCHGSVFNATGGVVNGPASTALQAYTGTINSTGIQFTVA